MKISRIEINGFRGVQGTVRLICGTGFTVISGRNGTGKSTICDALEYAISGRISRFQAAPNDKKEITEKGETIEDYIWWRGAKPPSVRSVKVHFSDEAGMDRGFISIDETGRHVEVDEALLYDRASAPMDPMLMLCQTGILRDGLIESLSTDVSETERFEFVNRAVGTSDLSQVESRAAEFQSVLKSDSEKHTRRYDDLREEIARLTSAISEARARATSSPGQNFEESLRRAAEAIGSDSTSVVDIISAVRKSEFQLSAEVAALERLQMDLPSTLEWAVRIEAVQQRCDEINREVRVADEKLRIANDSIIGAASAVRAAQQVMPIQTSLAQLREHGRRIGLIDGKCPLCGSALSKDIYDEHLDQIEKEVNRHSDELGHLVKAEADESHRYAEAKRQFDEKSIEYSRALSELDTLKTNTAQVQREAASLGVEFSADAVQARLEQRRARLKELENILSTVETFVALDEIAEMENRRTVLQQDAELCNTQIETAERALQATSRIAATAKRVSREILEEKLASLNPLLTELYVRLRPHVDYAEVSYRMRGDVRRFLRLEVGEEMNPRFTFSSGQRRALGLAFLLAVHLSRPWCKLRSLVLDDPIQHIDDYRALHLVEALSSVRQLGHQVICTTEDPGLAELLCRRLRSSRFATGTKIELDYKSGTGIQVTRVEEMTPLPASVLVSA